MVDVSYKILGGYSLCLIICGTILNCFTFIISTRKRLRTIPTFLFISIMSLMDIIPLYLMNLNFVYYYIFETGLESPIYCALFPFLHTFAQQASSWLLV